MTFVARIGTTQNLTLFWSRLIGASMLDTPLSFLGSFETDQGRLDSTFEIGGISRMTNNYTGLISNVSVL